MKKGKKAAIIIIAVIAAAAIVVGGLVLGGVIPVGNKRTASAQEIAVDDTAMTAYKTIPQVYKITLKSLYGMSADEARAAETYTGKEPFNFTVAALFPAAQVSGAAPQVPTGLLTHQIARF